MNGSLNVFVMRNPLKTVGARDQRVNDVHQRVHQSKHWDSTAINHRLDRKFRAQAIWLATPANNHAHQFWDPASVSCSVCRGLPSFLCFSPPGASPGRGPSCGARPLPSKRPSVRSAKGELLHHLSGSKPTRVDFYRAP